MEESTSLETAYALVCNKPIIMVREFGEYSQTASPSVMSILEKYSSDFIFESIDELTAPKLALRLGELAVHEVDYGLTQNEKAIIISEALALTRKYGVAWTEYTSR